MSEHEKAGADRAVDLLAKNKQLQVVCSQLETRLGIARKFGQEHKNRELANAKRCNEYYSQIKQLQAELQQVKEELDKHRWIPVSERLPKHSCRLLAYGKDGYDYETVAAVSYDLEFKKFRVLSDVTHWKPIILPE